MYTECSQIVMGNPWLLAFTLAIILDLLLHQIWSLWAFFISFQGIFGPHLWPDEWPDMSHQSWGWCARPPCAWWHWEWKSAYMALDQPQTWMNFLMVHHVWAIFTLTSVFLLIMPILLIPMNWVLTSMCIVNMWMVFRTFGIRMAMNLDELSYVSPYLSQIPLPFKCHVLVMMPMWTWKLFSARLALVRPRIRMNLLMLQHQNLYNFSIDFKSLWSRCGTPVNLRLARMCMINLRMVFRTFGTRTASNLDEVLYDLMHFQVGKIKENCLNLIHEIRTFCVQNRLRN